MATTPGAVYTGLAINTAGTRLYAADSAGGRVNVFDNTFAAVGLLGSFTDPNLPAGYVPFNVQNIGDRLYVAYAPAGLAAQRAATPGSGFVSVFDENGAFVQRLITGSQLAAPWALALAPAGFGKFGGDLLVGNFSFASSVINAFDPVTGLFQGSIPINVGTGNTAGGLGPSPSEAERATVVTPMHSISSTVSTARRRDCSARWWPFPSPRSSCCWGSGSPG